MKLKRLKRDKCSPGRKILSVMKCASIFLLACSLNVSASIYSQTTKLSLNVKNQSIKDILYQIENQTDFRFIYESGKINLDRKVSIQVKEQTVETILKQLFENEGIVYEITENNLILINPSQTLREQAVQGPQQAKKKVTGIVKDQNGEPIIGANVVEKGTTNGTVTDVDGKFSLEVSPSAILQISYVGFDTKEIPVKGKSTVDIFLAENMEDLDEVVVIGYGTMKKSDLTGAVSSIKGEKISAVASNDITDILQGKVAGMNITSSKQVDESGSIRIRGSRSLNASNDPLVIVDGVPGNMDAVNTNDIESIEVLKDAASTAIYGSRGANGVILITTKKAKEQKTRISYNGYIGLSVPNLVKMQSGDEYIQFRRDGYRYSNGWDKPFTDEDVFEAAELEVIKNRDFTDWIDLLYRNGMTQSHYVGISAGNKTTKLHLGLNYTKDEGYSKINYKDKYNITLNLDHEISRYVTIGLSARLQRNNSQGMTKFEEKLQYMTPLAKPYNEDGSMNYYPAPQNTSGYNVLANYDKDNYTNEYVKNAAYLTGYINIRFSKYLNNRANISYNVVNRKNGYFYGTNSYERKGTVPLAGKNYQEEVDYTFNNILSYDKNSGEHHLVLDGVFEATGYTKETGTMSGENQPVASTSYHNLGTAAENIQIGSSYEHWTLASFLARARWDWKGKYYANVAVRTDGSSRLAAGNKWAFFPSGGIAWRISEEDFFPKKDWISSLKLRASYGAVGNTAINPYQTLAGLTKYDYLFGEESTNKFFAYRPSMIPNADLGWEISRTTNIGIDFGLFNHRISGYIEGYITKTSDLLMAHDTKNMAARYMASGRMLHGVTHMPAIIRTTAITKRAGRV